MKRILNSFFWRSTKMAFLLIVLLGLYLKLNWRAQDRILQITYDWQQPNKPVYSPKKIVEVLATIESLSYNQLDKDYLDYTKSDEPKYKALLKDLTYYRVKRSDLNKHIVGEFRIKEFMCRDDYFIDCVLGRRSDVVCILNKDLFFKTLELLDELNRLGYNENGFTLVNGHRHPSYNEQIGGAKLSRHIKGQAVDIRINDVNDDGYANKTDKDIILDILDKEVIKDKGGIGLYPGTGNVHFDVRGTKARWNSF